MAIDLRFAELAVLDTVISLSKLALSCLLAWWLDNTPYAVLALAVPYAAAAVIEMSYCLPASGITLDELTPHPRQLLRTAKDLKWSLALALMISLNSQTNLLAVSRIVPVAAVGFIFFAYQLATQPMIILSSSLTNVLATTMARERQNPAMERDTMQRIFVGAMLLVPFVFLGAIALYPSVESLVYRGRWAPAYWPFACLAGGFCFATVTGVMTGSLVGLRQFKRLAGFETLRAIGLIGGTYVGYQICVLAGLKLDLKPTPDQPPQPELMTAVIIISAATGAGIAVMACAQLWLILRRYRMSRSDIVRALTFGPLVALLTMISSQSIGNSLAVSFVPDSLHPLGLASLKLIIIGAIYTTVAVLCVRFLAEETLRRTVDVLPRRVREVCVRVLRF